MQPPDVTGFLNFPDELIEKIVDLLDDESIIQLSMTCWKFHLLALPVVFTRANLPKDTTYYYLQQPPAHLLRALRMALFIHDVSSFTIILNPDTERLLPDILNLNRLISRMKTVAISAFFFRLSGLPLSSSNEGGAFEVERWTSEVIRLFNNVLDKSCVCLEVSGDMIPTDPTSTGAQPTNASTPRAALLGREQMGDRLRNLPNTSKRTILSLIRHLGSRRRRHHRHHHHHHHTLRRFHALSSDLFQSQFVNWTTSTLHATSHTLTEVSLKTDHVPASTWHDLLSKLTLPSLSKFRVTCNRIVEQRAVGFDDMLDFLIRHPSIVDLDLYGLTAPTNGRPWDLLPALQTLASYPELIIWLLDCECPFFRSILFRCGKAREYPLKNLKSLNIVSEVYPEPAAFNYNTFDNVLALLPPSLTTLTFSFFSFPGVTEWFDKQIPRGPLAALEGITNLELVSPWSSEGVVMDRIPRFLELFSGLEHFVYPALPPNLDMATVEEIFLRDIARACLGMRKVTMGRVEVLLDSLKEG